MAQLKTEAFGRGKMTTHPRLKMITYCVGVALAQWAATPALADSGVGVDTALGNALNPPGRSSVPRPLDNDASDSVRRSPTGQLYGIPYDLNEDRSKTADGWEYSGVIEAGIIAGDGDKKNAAFRQYRDLTNGPTLNYFEVEGNKPATANFIQAVGGGVGQHDQFYGVQFGRYNDWKVKLFYNETIHVFSDNYKSLYNGQGTGNLTLAGSLQGAAGATRVTSGSPTVGTGACSATAPCWSYNGATYSNATSLAAIDGVAGSYDAAGVLIAGSPQSNMAKAVNDQLATTPDSELALVRKKGGMRFDVTLTNNWKAYASLTEEKRTGSRPFSMNYGSGNMTVEIPEPIDYTTSDFLGGLQYVDKLTSVNLRASASMFRNNIDRLTVANPLFSPATPWGSVNQSTFDLNPDNTAFNVKGEYARKLPDLLNGRFTASVAYGSNRQNDALMAPLGSGVAAMNGIAPGAGFATGVTASNYFDISKWNTTAALSQTSANQQLDTKLLNLSLSLNPTDNLSVRGTLRHYETDNKANDGNGHQYTAYNPLTGQYGIIKYDDSPTTVVASTSGAVGSPCVSPAGATVAGCYFNGPVALTAAQALALGLPNAALAANNPSGLVVYSLARDYKQDNYVLSADYDLGGRSSVEGSYEREDYTRTMRERDKTWEDKLKLGYVNRDFEIATLRASLESDRRRGGDYNAGLLANVAYYPQVAYALALPGNSLTNIATQYLANAVGYTGANLTNYIARYSAQGRKTDLADRDQNVLNLRANFSPRQDLDLGAMVQWKDIKYPETFYGLEKDQLTSVNFDVNYQPSAAQQFTAYYSRQDGNKSTRGNAGNGSAITPAPSCAGFTSVVDLLANCAMTNYSTNTALGQYLSTSIWDMKTKDTNDVLGFNFQQDLGKVRLGLEYTYARGHTNISYDYGSTALTAAQAAIEVLNGNALPDMTTTQNALTVNLLMPINRQFSARLMARYEDFKISDWHYDSVIHSQVQNLDGGALLLDAGPTNYHATFVGVFLQYKL